MKIIEKLSTYAALLGVIGAIGGGFYTWGQFNLRLDQIENQEFVVNETVDLTEVNDSINNINIKLKELETTIIGLDNDVLDNLRNDIAGNSNDMKAITQDIIKDIKVLEVAIKDAGAGPNPSEIEKQDFENIDSVVKFFRDSQLEYVRKNLPCAQMKNGKPINPSACKSGDKTSVAKIINKVVPQEGVKEIKSFFYKLKNVFKKAK